MQAPVKPLQKLDTRFKPGQSGNPAGKPRGTRSKSTLAALALAEGKLTEIVQTLIDEALGGDISAAKILLDKCVPNKRESPLPELSLPVVETAADLPRLTGAILAAISEGRITPAEATALASLAGSHGKSIELAELEQRLQALEANIAAQGVR